ncbi:metallophosphoesterase [Candidatus Pacearchaeota archaeon]|nr:metallophosphoesterase [Candidatus Pacearchaeota archaeon]
MEKKKILEICIGKGFLLDKEMLEYFNKLEIKNVESIIDIFFGLGIKEKIINKKLFDKNIDKFRNLLVIENLEENIDKKGIKLLSTDFNFSKKIEVADFVAHFQSRYEEIKKVLEGKDIDNLISIRRIGINNGIYSIIATVIEKRITKNKNLLIEVEDLTGNSIILINKENTKLFNEAKEMMLDDIVIFRVTGSSDMLFANEIIYPDAFLAEEKYGKLDEYVAFSGDLHIGSKMFLEDNFLKFINWLNGNIGDARQKAIACKIKYLFLTGDNIDGVGIYQDQEKLLNIKSCKGQYNKLEELLKKIRKNVQIIMCPGQHDSVWVGEQQKSIPSKWAPGLHNMENLHLVPNPSLVEINDGFKVLMYHGASINRFIDEISEIRIKYKHNHPTKVVREMLKRRHLAPTHGLMDYVPNRNNDAMTINIIPDIIATADQHRAEVDVYNNILMVASSCWQSITPFEEKVGNTPDPCKVPLFNLKTREIKIIDFSDSHGIKWNEGEDLVCKLK